MNKIVLEFESSVMRSHASLDTDSGAFESIDGMKPQDNSGLVLGSVPREISDLLFSTFCRLCELLGHPAFGVPTIPDPVPPSARPPQERQQDAIFRVRHRTLGRHVHCSLFVAPRPGQTFAKCGDFIVDINEMMALRLAMQRVEFIDEDAGL